MFSDKDIDSMVKQIMVKACESNTDMNLYKQEKNNTEKCEYADNKTLVLSPSQAMIIGGILGGVLEVESILVDKDQDVQIVLAGSLKEKSELDKMLDQIGQMPFGEVYKALSNRLG